MTDRKLGRAGRAKGCKRKQAEVAGPGCGRLVFVPVESVDWIEAAGNCVRLHQGRRQHLLRRTLTALNQRLRGRFVRIRRTALVNAGAITALEPYGKGSHVVHLRDGAPPHLQPVRGGGHGGS